MNVTMPLASTGRGSSVDGPACPKHMVYGPCGGVEHDGTCEIGSQRCAFLDRPLAAWAEAPVAPTVLTDAAAEMRDLIRQHPIVVGDFPARAMDIQSLKECSAILKGNVDAVLAGDAGNAREQYSPSTRSHLINSQGLRVWSGVNCRDRNRVALEGEIASLAAMGAAGVHCVTGDHTQVGTRPDAQAVFDLDSTRLTSLAAAAGHLVSVGETPLSPPTGLRPARLVEKFRAGARVCFVNHCGAARTVHQFVRSARDLGADMLYVACLPVVVDAGSAALLKSFTSLVLPEGYLDPILESSDPFTTGIEAAVTMAEELLDGGMIAGVNLSGGPLPGGEARFAEALATIGRRLLSA